jgi:hypothetical protein
MRLTIICLFFINLVFGQGIPQGFSHRGVINDKDNKPVANKDVFIKITILDDDKDELFIETHQVKTNVTGHYNLVIGKGKKQYPIDENFQLGDIKWGDETKSKSYRIEVDITGSGNNYTVSGNSQFFSVPYAMFSLNSLNSMNNLENSSCSNLTILDSINSLRTTECNFTEGSVVYIRCHSQYWDGGGGFFILSNNETIKNQQGNVIADNDGTVVVNPNFADLRWVRKIDNYIDVSFFGSIGSGNPATDDGLKIQKAIDFAFETSSRSARSKTVYISSGYYYIHDKIVLKSGVNIKGDGFDNSILAASNSIKKDGSMIEMASGKIRGILISDITFTGGVLDNSTIKNCFHLKGTIGSGDHGGLENCTFKNIRINGFNGCGIILEGSGPNDNYKLPNQDLVFEQVHISRVKDNTNCLLIQGQNSQITFTNCGFDGKMNWTDLNAGNNFPTNKLFNVVLENKGHIAPSIIKFNTCTFQYSEYGVFLRYAENVTFDNCWFELLDRAIGIVKSGGIPSKGINVLNSRFANASGFGTYWDKVTNINSPPSGSCIHIEDSQVNVLNNFVTVSGTFNNNNVFVRNYGIDSDINILNNSYQNDNLGIVKSGLGNTFGVANKTLTLNNDVLNTSSYKFITVNPFGSNIKEIKSNINTGETITIKANGTIKFDNSKNIVFAKTTVTATAPFTLNANEMATFIKIDNPKTVGSTIYNETYLLISVNKTF